MHEEGPDEPTMSESADLHGAGRRRRTTIKDVAKATGVSFQTVSAALHGYGRVSEATRHRVLDKAAELNYTPNTLARELQRQRSQVVAVVSSDISDTTLAQPIVGIEREARRSGYSIIIATLDEHGADVSDYLRVLLERRVDGVILNAPQLEDSEDLTPMLGAVPTVSLHRVVPPQVTRVSADDRETARLAMDHLLGLGHRAIGMIAGPSDREVARIRTAEYVAALKRSGLPVDETRTEASDWTADGGYAAARALLNRCHSLTAIYAQNDMMAMGALAALHEAGLRVPEDCSVVGCDDVGITARTVPSLTTVRIPFVEIGQTAMGLLERRLAGERVSECTVLPVALRIRSSSAQVRWPAAAASPEAPWERSASK